MKQEFYNKLIKSFVAKDRFAAHNALSLVDVSQGYARVELLVEEQHLNGVNIAHGGVIFTVADLAMGLAAHSHGRVAVTLSADISFLNPAQLGDRLIAEAEELALRRSVASYLVSVKNGDGLLLASMKCQAFRKGEIVW